jgi:hypothetical protein
MRILTNSLTAWSRILEKFIVVYAQLVKKFPVFYGTRRFITVFTRARHWPLSSARLIQYTPQFPDIHFNIILPSTPRSSEWSLPLRLSNQNV